MPTLTPIERCDACSDSPVFDPTPFEHDVIDAESCHSCYKCCECQRCEVVRMEHGTFVKFTCPDCSAPVWATGCYPFLCIHAEDADCPTCCREDYSKLSEAYHAAT